MRRWTAPVICASIFFPLVTAGRAGATDTRLAKRIDRYLEFDIRSNASSASSTSLLAATLWAIVPATVA